MSLRLVAPALTLVVGCASAQQKAPAQVTPQAQINIAEYVKNPPASSIFPTNGVDGHPLEIGLGKPVVVQGNRTWLVELHGWLSAVATSCDTDGPDWHYLLEIDPDWADAAGMPLALVLRPGNMVAQVTDEQLGDPQGRRIVGVPNVAVDLNGYVPSQHGGAAAPATWGAFGKDCKHHNESAAWAFDPSKPVSQLDSLAPGKYVRMYGALVTDKPSTEQTSEMHPPDIITVLPDKPHRTNLRSVVVTAENCSTGPCEKTTLDVDIAAPPHQPDEEAPDILFTEEVLPSTNYRSITEGHKNATGKYDGAEVTVTDTGIHVHVTVQGQPGAQGRFAAFYRVSWGVNTGA